MTALQETLYRKNEDYFKIYLISSIQKYRYGCHGQLLLADRCHRVFSSDTTSPNCTKLDMMNLLKYFTMLNHWAPEWSPGLDP